MNRTRIVAIVLRWLARILSMLLVGLIATFVIGEAHGNVLNVMRGTHGMCLVFPFGLCVGLILAWRWELAGSLVSLASVGVMFINEGLYSGKWRREIGWFFWAIPAMVFLISWAWSQATRLRTQQA